MNQANELLNSLTEEEIAAYSAGTGSEPHIVIGEDRFITVPEQLKRLAVQFDHDIETVTFDCPRYWDGIDMSVMPIYINYKLTDGSVGSYPAKNIQVENNIMHFDWTISEHVTKLKGNIKFLVCVKKVDDTEGTLVNHWNSELCIDCYISEGMEGMDGEYVQNSYPDIVTELLERMTSAETNASNASTKAANAEAVAISSQESAAASAAKAADYAEQVSDMTLWVNTHSLSESDYIGEYVDTDGAYSGYFNLGDLKPGEYIITINHKDDPYDYWIFREASKRIFHNPYGSNDYTDISFETIDSANKKGRFVIDELKNDCRLHIQSISNHAPYTINVYRATNGQDILDLEKQIAIKPTKNEVSNAVKGIANGPIIRVDDVSPIEHTAKATVSGKNVYHAYTTRDLEAYGMVVSMSENSSELIFNGTSTREFSFNIGDNILLTPGTYSVSVSGLNTGVSDRVYLCKSADETNVFVNFIRTDEPKTFTIDTDTLVRVKGVVEANSTYNNVSVRVQIEKGLISTEYVPYVDPSTVTLTRCGKNLFDSSKLLLANGWTESNGVYSGLPGTLHNIYGPNVGSPILSRFKPSTQYTLSFDAYAEITSDRPVGGTFMIYYDDGSHNGKIINTSTMSRYTYTSDPGKTIVELYISYGHNVKTYIKNIQVEEGTTVTPYESYNGETVKPSTDGTVEFESVSPIMTVYTDTDGMTAHVRYNRDTTKMFESYVITDEIKNDIAAVVEDDMAEVLVALNNYASQVIGGGS